MRDGQCKCGGQYIPNIFYDDGRLIKLTITCNACGDKVCDVRAIRNYKNMKCSSSCMRFADGSYYCGAMPVGEPYFGKA